MMEAKSIIRIENEQVSLKEQFYKNNRFNFIMSLLSVILFGSCNIFTAYLFKNLADTAVYGTVSDLKRLIIISGLFILAYSCIALIRRFFLNKFINTAMVQYKNAIFNSLLYRKYNAFDSNIIGKYLSAMTNDIVSIENNYLLGTVNILYQLILFVLGLASMFYLNYRLTICILLSCLIPLLVTKMFGNKLQVLEKNVSNKNASFVSIVKELFSGLAVVKSFQAEDEISSIFGSYNIKTEDTKMEYRKLDNLINLSMFSSTFVITVVVCGAGAYLSIIGKETLGTIIAFVQLLDYVVNPVGQIGGLVAKRSAAESLINKMNDLCTDVEEDEDNCLRVKEINRNISFNNVTFSYDGNNNAIKNFTYTFEKGKSYAIVGLSGSGKSTILKLILGYYTDYDGIIEIDDHEVRNICSKDLVRLISYIQQDVFIFNDSILNNMTLFKDYNSKEINEAINKSGLKDLVNEKSVEYICGEEGMLISGGESQRISLARAILSGHSLFLADEATASLDNISDSEIQRSILEISDATKIVVTHRLNKEVLVDYDCILVMNNGELVELGKFEDLYNKKGMFYSIYNIEKAVDDKK